MSEQKPHEQPDPPRPVARMTPEEFFEMRRELRRARRLGQRRIHLAMAMIAGVGVLFLFDIVKVMPANVALFLMELLLVAACSIGGESE